MEILPERAKETDEIASGSTLIPLVVSWMWVGLPLAWGVSQTMIQSLALFE